MVAIPAGTFEMGSGDGAVDERPPHSVALDAFYLDQFEVTNARYAACVEAGACQPPAQAGSFTRSAYFAAADFADYPVVAVNWEQAVAFCGWDGGKRLPTEAEWEYAARGTDGRRYPWGPSFDLARLPAAESDTVRAGSFPAGASPFGLHDLGGNVLEWVADYYEPLYYAESPEDNPPGPEFGDERVLRGGSFGNADAGFYTATRRYHLAPDYADVDVGFRCAQDGP
jgi:serine/threonine-protein kinase